MNNEQLRNNLNACIEWCMERANRIGNRNLYIPFGSYDGTAREDGFNCHSHRFSVCTIDGKPTILIGHSSAYVFHFYGYDKEYLSHRVSHTHHSLDELPITIVETFLLNWLDIKSAIINRIDETNRLNDFKV